jgi:hypothetical protein
LNEALGQAQGRPTLVEQKEKRKADKFVLIRPLDTPGGYRATPQRRPPCD